MKRLTCVCGKVIEADNDDELWAMVEAHLAADHPDLVGQIARDDIVARAEEL